MINIVINMGIQFGYHKIYILAGPVMTGQVMARSQASSILRLLRLVVMAGVGTVISNPANTPHLHATMPGRVRVGCICGLK